MVKTGSSKRSHRYFFTLFIDGIRCIVATARITDQCLEIFRVENAFVIGSIVWIFGIHREFLYPYHSAKWVFIVEISILPDFYIANSSTIEQFAANYSHTVGYNESCTMTNRNSTAYSICYYLCLRMYFYIGIQIASSD